MKSCPICQSDKSRPERVLNSIDLMKCGNCDFVYADIKDDYIEKMNSDNADGASSAYEDQQTFIDVLWFQRIVHKFTKVKGRGKVLDVGCGNGLLLKCFVEFGWDCYGVDLSPWSRKYSDLYGFNFIQGKLENLRLEENSFDLIVSTSTLEHIAQPLLHVEEVARLLKPGGIGYFVGIPNYRSISIVLGLSRFYSNTPPGHVNYFTTKTARTLSRFLKTPIQGVTVKTYGIPEMYEIYNLLTLAFHGKKDGVSKDTVSNGTLQRKQKKSMSNTMGKSIITIYYYLGRLFSLGDKLEITIVK